MPAGLNISCNPLNVKAFEPISEDYVYMASYWSATNVTAMTNCCAPKPAKEQGCFTWCLLNEEIDNNDNDARMHWRADFEACLNRVGRETSGNQSYVAPGVVAVLQSGAEARNPGGTLKMTVMSVAVGLGLLSWVLT